MTGQIFSGSVEIANSRSNLDFFYFLGQRSLLIQDSGHCVLKCYKLDLLEDVELGSSLLICQLIALTFQYCFSKAGFHSLKYYSSFQHDLKYLIVVMPLWRQPVVFPL